MAKSELLQVRVDAKVKPEAAKHETARDLLSRRLAGQQVVVSP